MIDVDQDTGIVLCPTCGGNNLHHDVVDVFVRQEEDSETGYHARLSPNGCAAHDHSMARNPSARRDGLKIQFWCENGCLPPVLDIVQHKGSTYIKWSR